MLYECQCVCKISVFLPCLILSFLSCLLVFFDVYFSFTFIHAPILVQQPYFPCTLCNDNQGHSDSDSDSISNIFHSNFTNNCRKLASWPVLVNKSTYVSQPYHDLNGFLSALLSLPRRCVVTWHASWNIS